MTGYVLSVAADLDLDEIWEYIAADNIGAADRWIEKLFDASEALARTPGSRHAGLAGHPRLPAAPSAVGASEERSRIKGWFAGCPSLCHKMPHSS
jgi:plasmid stabilization system protein ParE